ncbi:MAG: nucleoside deaminase [Acidobacteriota bacterium]
MTAEFTPDWVFDDVDREMMTLALEEARRAGAAGDIPIGAVVCAADRTPLARAGNRRERDHDPTAHAELLALRDASRTLGAWRLAGCFLYVTLEPCPMCAAAAVLSRLGTLIYAAPDPKAGFAGSLGNLLEDPRLNHRVAWRSGVMAGESAALLASFFANLRARG